MRGAVKRSFAETAKKGDGILNMLELSDSIKGATTEQPHRHAHSFPNRLTLNKSPFHPVHAVVQSHAEQAQPVSCLPDTHVSTLAIATFSHPRVCKNHNPARTRGTRADLIIIISLAATSAQASPDRGNRKPRRRKRDARTIPRPAGFSRRLCCRERRLICTGRLS